MEGGPLVDARWLAEHLAEPRVVVADVRWYLDGRRGEDAYLAGHVPGAVFVDLDRELASPRGAGRPGRHPLPSLEQLAALAERLGADRDAVVVAYDDAGGSIAARLWWLLRWVGLNVVRVLDGGLAAWTAAGFALETTAHARASRRVSVPELAPDRSRVVDKLAVRTKLAARSALVLDARAAERYEGRSEPVDARPGHVPGAVSAPWAGNLAAPGGAFLARDALAARYRALGALDAAEVVAYCGSGVTACHDLLALSLAGRDDALLYEGSWSDWAADPSLPAATGKEP